MRAESAGVSFAVDVGRVESADVSVLDLGHVEAAPRHHAHLLTLNQLVAADPNRRVL